MAPPDRRRLPTGRARSFLITSQPVNTKKALCHMSALDSYEKSHGSQKYISVPKSYHIFSRFAKSISRSPQKQNKRYHFLKVRKHISVPKSYHISQRFAKYISRSQTVIICFKVRNKKSISRSHKVIIFPKVRKNKRVYPKAKVNIFSQGSHKYISVPTSYHISQGSQTYISDPTSYHICSRFAKVYLGPQPHNL